MGPNGALAPDAITTTLAGVHEILKMYTRFPGPDKPRCTYTVDPDTVYCGSFRPRNHDNLKFFFKYIN